MHLYGLYADPAIHSLSPLLYNTAFMEEGISSFYLAFTVPAESLSGAISGMRSLDIKGINVSMPHKQAILSYLDRLTERALLCGAVNTVVNERGILTGCNTDVGGFIQAVRREDREIKGKHCILLGLGGAGCACLAGLAIEGAASVSIFVRRQNAEAHRLQAETIGAKTGLPWELFDIGDREALMQAMHKADLVIQASDVGMQGEKAGQSLIPDASFFHADMFAMDVIYRPAKTVFLKQAERAGCRTANGLSMLLHQAALSFRLFTGRDLPMERVKKKLEERGKIEKEITFADRRGDLC